MASNATILVFEIAILRLLTSINRHKDRTLMNLRILRETAEYLSGEKKLAGYNKTHSGSILAGYGDSLEVGHEVIFFEIESMVDVIGNSRLKRWFVVTATFLKILRSPIEQGRKRISFSLPGALKSPSMGGAFKIKRRIMTTNTRKED